MRPKTTKQPRSVHHTASSGSTEATTTHASSEERRTIPRFFAPPITTATASPPFCPVESWPSPTTTQSPSSTIPTTAVVRHTTMIKDLAASPQGLWLASVGYDSLILVWKTRSSCLHGILQGHTSFVYDLAWAPLPSYQSPLYRKDNHKDEGHLASSSADHTVRLWHVSTLTCLRILQTTIVPLTLDWSSSSSFLQSAARKEGPSFPHAANKKNNDDDSSNNESWLIAGGFPQGNLFVWNVLHHPQEVTLKQGEEETAPTTAAAALRGGQCQTGKSQPRPQPQQHQEEDQLHNNSSTNAATYSPHLSLTVDDEPTHTRQDHAKVISALRVSPDGQWLASGGYERGAAQISLWSTTTWTVQCILPGHERAVATLEWGHHPPEKATNNHHTSNTNNNPSRQLLLASGSDDGTVRIWKITSFDKSSPSASTVPRDDKNKNKNKAPCTSTLSGLCIAILETQQQQQNSHQQEEPITSSSCPVSSIQWLGPDNQWLVCAAGSQIQVWHTAGPTYSCLYQWSVPGGGGGGVVPSLQLVNGTTPEKSRSSTGGGSLSSALGDYYLVWANSVEWRSPFSNIGGIQQWHGMGYVVARHNLQRFAQSHARSLLRKQCSTVKSSSVTSTDESLHDDREDNFRWCELVEQTAQLVLQWFDAKKQGVHQQRIPQETTQ